VPVDALELPELDWPAAVEADVFFVWPVDVLLPVD